MKKRTFEYPEGVMFFKKGENLYDRLLKEIVIQCAKWMEIHPKEKILFQDKKSTITIIAATSGAKSIGRIIKSHIESFRLHEEQQKVRSTDMYSFGVSHVQLIADFGWDEYIRVCIQRTTIPPEDRVPMFEHEVRLMTGND